VRSSLASSRSARGGRAVQRDPLLAVPASATRAVATSPIVDAIVAASLVPVRA
jgi:hypothetical protein